MRRAADHVTLHGENIVNNRVGGSEALSGLCRFEALRLSFASSNRSSTTPSAAFGSGRQDRPGGQGLLNSDASNRLPAYENVWTSAAKDALLCVSAGELLRLATRLRARLAICGASGRASVNSDAATKRSPRQCQLFPSRSPTTLSASPPGRGAPKIERGSSSEGLVRRGRSQEVLEPQQDDDQKNERQIEPDASARDYCIHCGRNRRGAGAGGRYIARRQTAEARKRDQTGPHAHIAEPTRRRHYRTDDAGDGLATTQRTRVPGGHGEKEARLFSDIVQAGRRRSPLPH